MTKVLLIINVVVDALVHPQALHDALLRPLFVPLRPVVAKPMIKLIVTIKIINIANTMYQTFKSLSLEWYNNISTWNLKQKQKQKSFTNKISVVTNHEQVYRRCLSNVKLSQYLSKVQKQQIKLMWLFHKAISRNNFYKMLKQLKLTLYSWENLHA